MNLESLSQMEEKVEKGKELVREISVLKNQLEKVEKVKSIDEVAFTEYNNGCFYVANFKITDELRKTFIETAKVEIKRLEQELADL